ncbi:ABC transporter substrate-binding protein [Alkalimonas delamerensis]|uniref:ABC transporter substrate-binding protein n=1 Tax=Alkalimonas delamerensis TaxID=265981 RepID=A0ABT9GS22_9GAMM|nr:ABC transporter substrate-binding protein [Alkalimonas delamerensis]MDP4529570.1 ABC transporter substrate-binding protein [Alkalimonas delamerensis]
MINTIAYLFIALLSFPIMAETLRAIISETNTPPFIINSESSPKTGLVIDISKEVANQLGWDLEYLTIPRARTEQWIQGGQADLWCFTSPKWVNEPELMLWSEPLYTTVDLLIRKTSTSPFRQLSDLYRKKVGTSRGFNYPELDALFSKGDASRDDALSLRENLQRLQLDRVDVVISDSFSYSYYVNVNKYSEETQALVADQIGFEAQPSYCAISHSNPHKAAAIRQALTTIHAHGYIDLWLQKYF